MPIYEYACRACGEHLDALQKLSDAPLTDCPACGKPELVKQVTAAAFHLKGSGWYKTDFKDGQKKDAPKRDEALKGDAAGGEGTAAPAPSTAEATASKDDAKKSAESSPAAPAAAASKAEPPSTPAPAKSATKPDAA